MAELPIFWQRVLENSMLMDIETTGLDPTRFSPLSAARKRYGALGPPRQTWFQFTTAKMGMEAPYRQYERIRATVPPMEPFPLHMWHQEWAQQRAAYLASGRQLARPQDFFTRMFEEAAGQGGFIWAHNVHFDISQFASEFARPEAVRRLYEGMAVPPFREFRPYHTRIWPTQTRRAFQFRKAAYETPASALGAMRGWYGEYREMVRQAVISGKPAILDTMFISQAMMAMGQERGAMRRTMDVFTGARLEALYTAFGFGKYASHLDIADVAAMEKLMEPIIATTEALYSGQALTGQQAAALYRLGRLQPRLAAQNVEAMFAQAQIELRGPGKQFRYTAKGGVQYYSRDYEDILRIYERRAAGIQYDLPVRDIWERVGSATTQDLEALLAKGRTVPALRPFEELGARVVGAKAELMRALIGKNPILTAGLAVAGGAILLGAILPDRQRSNTIEGLSHRGIAQDTRHLLTDFGSGFVARVFRRIGQVLERGAPGILQAEEARLVASTRQGGMAAIRRPAPEPVRTYKNMFGERPINELTLATRITGPPGSDPVGERIASEIMVMRNPAAYQKRPPGLTGAPIDFRPSDVRPVASFGRGYSPIFGTQEVIGMAEEARSLSPYEFAARLGVRFKSGVTAPMGQTGPQGAITMSTQEQAGAIAETYAKSGKMTNIIGAPIEATPKNIAGFKEQAVEQIRKLEKRGAKPGPMVEPSAPETIVFGGFLGLSRQIPAIAETKQLSEAALFNIIAENPENVIGGFALREAGGAGAERLVIKAQARGVTPQALAQLKQQTGVTTEAFGAVYDPLEELIMGSRFDLSRAERLAALKEAPGGTALLDYARKFALRGVAQQRIGLLRQVTSMTGTPLGWGSVRELAQTGEELLSTRSGRAELLKLFTFHEAAEQRALKVWTTPGFREEAESYTLRAIEEGSLYGFGGVKQGISHEAAVAQEELFMRRMLGPESKAYQFWGKYRRLMLDPYYHGYDLTRKGAYFKIEGFQHQGVDPIIRRWITDFGSGFKEAAGAVGKAVETLFQRVGRQKGLMRKALLQAIRSGALEQGAVIRTTNIDDLMYILQNRMLRVGGTAEGREAIAGIQVIGKEPVIPIYGGHKKTPFAIIAKEEHIIGRGESVREAWIDPNVDIRKLRYMVGTGPRPEIMTWEELNEYLLSVRRHAREIKQTQGAQTVAKMVGPDTMKQYAPSPPPRCRNASSPHVANSIGEGMVQRQFKSRKGSKRMYQP